MRFQGLLASALCAARHHIPRCAARTGMLGVAEAPVEAEEGVALRLERVPVGAYHYIPNDTA